MGGVRKLQFLLIYSTIYADVGGWDLKSQKQADVILEWSLRPFLPQIGSLSKSLQLLFVSFPASGFSYPDPGQTWKVWNHERQCPHPDLKRLPDLDCVGNLISSLSFDEFGFQIVGTWIELVNEMSCGQLVMPFFPQNLVYMAHIRQITKPFDIFQQKIKECYFN